MPDHDRDDPSPPLWLPPASRQTGSRLYRFLDELVRAGTLRSPDYDEAWAWSVGNLEEFWGAIAEHFDVAWSVPPERILESTSVSDASWFPGARLNYAGHALRADEDRLAIIARSQTRDDADFTYGRLRELVGRARAGLQAAGVGRGDRVAAYLPNIPEAVVAFLATASLGAIWTSCAAEMGVRGVLDRFQQVEPTVLIGVDGYRYGDRAVDRRAELDRIRAGLPSVRRAVWIPYLDPSSQPPEGWLSWEALTAKSAPFDEVDVAFDHPLYILYSSGTTGAPKAIVHGHGGMLLEHMKTLGLHFDIDSASRFFWFTTTGWMVWNFLVSGLTLGATVILFDGDPAWPRPDALWALVDETRATCAGMGAGFFAMGHKLGLRPGDEFGLDDLQLLGSTGSPLAPAAARWVYDSVKSDVLLSSASGGTDLCTAFVGASPLHPVWADQIATRFLGAHVEVVDDNGRPVVGQEGELVVSSPMPSMPVGFWGDDDGQRYHHTYFGRLAGVWLHGDRMILTERGTCVVTGRSDGTLNRGGVRMGTSEFYALVEETEEVLDSLVVHLTDDSGGPGTLWCFVVTADGYELDDELRDKLARTLRRELSPRHVPDHFVAVDAVPKTLTGKKLEVPVKHILAGTPVEEALALAAVADPDSLEPFRELGRTLNTPRA